MARRLALPAACIALFLAWGLGRLPWEPRGSVQPGPQLSVSVPSREPARPAAPAPNDATSPASGAVVAPAEVFGSAAGCAAAIAAGSRLERAARSARFASWNLHWFPDGKPGQSNTGTDVAWLACALWWLNADVVAVQEVKQNVRAEAAARQLVAELNRLTGSRHGLQLDDCGSRVPQHVGLLWNAEHVSATEIETVAALNPSGEPCGKQWRPGLSARLRFTGGLDLVVVSAHFKSMADARSLELRRASFGALGAVLAENRERTADGDLLLLGDLNTMGCDECSPPVSARDELASVARVLGPSGLRVVPADAPGTHFHKGRPSLLDHALAAQGMRELAASARTRVIGACASDAEAPRSSRARRAAKKAKLGLSDHCPIVLDLSDRDLD